MRYDDHNPPHFHARYSGATASFLFNGEVLAESAAKKIPDRQKALIKAWALLHEEELAAEWELASESERELFKIDPLR